MMRPSFADRGTSSGRQPSGSEDAFPRSRAQISHFFRDLDLVDPGVVVSRLWPAPAESAAEEVGHAKTAAEIDAEVAFFCGVARKP
ncbi:SAM-dependent methyltransferase [Nocardia sp. CA2R105]|uniref:SAM-dependent methyltransferase n=1 Tax=Nocardia coffeae TaxID=2873381 RepID=UPI001CA64CDB|nr:SAM-dependent methyltransferase [Nocardia coffeae]MBY8861932.1 SAM-dependent methyltransferase [Nocardia coffeae]